MGKKDNRIRELEEKKTELEYDVTFLEERIIELTNQINDLGKPTESLNLKDALKKLKDRDPHYGGDMCFDFWPPSDWVRFSFRKWDVTQYCQLCIGPLRIEFYGM